MASSTDTAAPRVKCEDAERSALSSSNEDAGEDPSIGRPIEGWTEIQESVQPSRLTPNVCFRYSRWIKHTAESDAAADALDWERLRPGDLVHVAERTWVRGAADTEPWMRVPADVFEALPVACPAADPECAGLVLGKRRAAERTEWMARKSWNANKSHATRARRQEEERMRQEQENEELLRLLEEAGVENVRETGNNRVTIRLPANKPPSDQDAFPGQLPEPEAPEFDAFVATEIGDENVPEGQSAAPDTQAQAAATTLRDSLTPLPESPVPVQRARSAARDDTPEGPNAQGRSILSPSLARPLPTPPPTERGSSAAAATTNAPAAQATADIDNHAPIASESVAGVKRRRVLSASSSEASGSDDEFAGQGTDELRRALVEVRAKKAAQRAKIERDLVKYQLEDEMRELDEMRVERKHLRAKRRAVE